ncbi:MAG: hypothetical protein JO101_06035 [Candidatus Eremiobacteraeota bacterium]|nr:hypothetical protein [Candidatus Eremiobacteraeota bacterium]
MDGFTRLALVGGGLVGLACVIYGRRLTDTDEDDATRELGTTLLGITVVGALATIAVRFL